MELKYTELLVPTDGVYEFVYPTVVGPRYSEKPRKPGVARGRSSRRRTPARASRRAASSTPGVVSTGVPFQELDVTVAPARRPHRRRGPRGDRARRLRAARSAIATSSSATDWPARRSPRDCCCIRAADENFFLLMAEPPQAVEPRRDAAARVHLRPRRLGIDERLSAGHGEEADARPRERASTHRHVQHRRLCRRLRHVLAASVPATRPNLTRALQFIGQQERRRRHAAADCAPAGGATAAATEASRAASSW